MTLAWFIDAFLWRVGAGVIDVIENEREVSIGLSELVGKVALIDPEVTNNINRVATSIGNSGIDGEVLAVWDGDILTQVDRKRVAGLVINAVLAEAVDNGVV